MFIIYFDALTYISLYRSVIVRTQFTVFMALKKALQNVITSINIKKV